MRHRAGIATLGLAIALPLSTAQTQQTATASAAAPSGPAMNDVAPDFTLPGADKYGLLKTPVKLSDFRGRTVVLAFFFQARTKG